MDQLMIDIQAIDVGRVSQCDIPLLHELSDMLDHLYFRLVKAELI